MVTCVLLASGSSISKSDMADIVSGVFSFFFLVISHQKENREQGQIYIFFVSHVVVLPVLFATLLQKNCFVKSSFDHD